MIVARSMDSGATSPEAVALLNPIRSSRSAPFVKSHQSLAKLVPIRICIAHRRATTDAVKYTLPWYQASAAPIMTGTTAAGRVWGLAALHQMDHLLMSMGLNHYVKADAA